MYQYPALKGKRLPDDTIITKAEILADYEDAKSRDTRPLMSILMAMKRADPRLRGHIVTRQTAMSSFGWVIKPSNPNPEQREIDEAERAKTRCTRIIQEVINHRLQASLYDAMVIQTEISRDPNNGAIQKPIRRFRPNEIEKSNDYEVSIYADGEQKRLELTLPVEMGMPTEDRASYIIAVGDDDERGGLLRSILWHEVYLLGNRKEWANFNKKLKGLLQGTYREWATPAEKEQATKAMKTATKEQYILTSEAIQFKLNQIAQAGAGTSFKEFIDDIKIDVAISLLGQANTSEMPKNGGSRAGLQVLNLIRSDIMFDDMIRTQNCVNDQVLLNDARLNLDASAEAAPYIFQFRIPDGLDAEVRARIILDAYNAGFPLNTGEAYNQLELTPPKDTPDTLVKQTALI